MKNGEETDEVAVACLELEKLLARGLVSGGLRPADATASGLECSWYLSTVHTYAWGRIGANQPPNCMTAPRLYSKQKVQKHKRDEGMA